MKLQDLRFLRFSACLVIVSMLLFSCLLQKKIMYLQGTSNSDTARQFINERKLTYLIQPGDNLYIKVVSLDEKTAILFNLLESTSGAQNANDQGIYLNSYTVSDEGFIEFPLPVKIIVQNLNKVARWMQRPC
jgi:polysaccharide biosynthesis/export protein